MLVAKLRAKLRDRLDKDVGCCSGARAARSRRRACRRAKEVGRQRRVGVIAQVPANRVPGAELELDIVFCPAEPARLDVTGNAPTITDKIPADERAIRD